MASADNSRHEGRVPQGTSGSNSMASKMDMRIDQLSTVAELAGADADAMADYFVCESWRADLSTGLIELGQQSLAMHDVKTGPCGIMTMIRVYDRADWAKILWAFEEASGTSASFTFSTTIRIRPGVYRPVFCAGESDTAEGTAGVIQGLFAFSRFCIETAVSRSRSLN